MSEILIENYGKVAIVRLSNGVTNAINPELIQKLSGVLSTIQKEFHGMILAGGDKFFSIGFDLPMLLKCNRAEMSDFLYQFCDLTLKLFTLPMPTCSAVMGHATAGGCILALSTDYRFVASGKKLIGLNEIKLGVPVPYLADLMLRQIVSDRSATEILYSGEFMTSADAKQIGLADEVLPSEEVEGKAVKKISKIADLSTAAFSSIKLNRVETVRTQYMANFKSKNEALLDCWFSKPVQELLESAAKKF